MEDLGLKFRKIIYFFIALFIIALIVTIVCLLILKYEVEGEDNMPFELTQLVVVSTAEGKDIEGEKTWNFNLTQYNDIFLTISKNKNYKETEIIKKVIIENLKVEEKPIKGEIVAYMISSSRDTTYEYKDEYLIKDNLQFKGDEETNLKERTIANQGGVISFRYVNTNLRRIFIR